MTEFDDLRNLANLLSKYIIDEKIEIFDKKNELVHLFQSYKRQYSLVGTQDISNLIHLQSNHSDKKILLECRQEHCLTCYYEEVMSEK